jgi:dienelactone hydrolase
MDGRPGHPYDHRTFAADSHALGSDNRRSAMAISKRDVTFRSGDSFASGWFFLPEDAGSGAAAPAVAMAHGIGAVKEMFLEPIARRFAEAGFAVLVFDYRSFGASGGEPRQRVFPVTRPRTTAARLRGCRCSHR